MPSMSAAPIGRVSQPRTLQLALLCQAGPAQGVRGEREVGLSTLGVEAKDGCAKLLCPERMGSRNGDRPDLQRAGSVCRRPARTFPVACLLHWPSGAQQHSPTARLSVCLGGGSPAEGRRRLGVDDFQSGRFGRWAAAKGHRRHSRFAHGERMVEQRPSGRRRVKRRGSIATLVSCSGATSGAPRSPGSPRLFARGSISAALLRGHPIREAGLLRDPAVHGDLRGVSDRAECLSPAHLSPQQKQQMIRLANRFAITGLGFLALAMSGAIMLITNVLFGSALTVITTATAVCMFATLWYLLSLQQRARVRSLEHHGDRPAAPPAGPPVRLEREAQGSCARAAPDRLPRPPP